MFGLGEKMSRSCGASVAGWRMTRTRVNAIFWRGITWPGELVVSVSSSIIFVSRPVDVIFFCTIDGDSHEVRTSFCEICFFPPEVCCVVI